MNKKEKHFDVKSVTISIYIYIYICVCVYIPKYYSLQLINQETGKVWKKILKYFINDDNDAFLITFFHLKWGYMKNSI